MSKILNLDDDSSSLLGPMPNPVLSTCQKLSKWAKEHSWLVTSEDADGSILFRRKRIIPINPNIGKFLMFFVLFESHCGKMVGMEISGRIAKIHCGEPWQGW